MLKRCLSRHADERLGFAPGMRTHTRTPACHGDKNLESFSHNAILPREMCRDTIHRAQKVIVSLLTILHVEFVLFPLDIPATGGDDHPPAIRAGHPAERTSFLRSHYLFYPS